MVKEQAFLLCMLHMAKTMMEELYINPSGLKQAFPEFPNRFNRLSPDALQIGTPVYNLQNCKPKFQGLVENVEASEDGQEYIIQYVSGETDLLPKSGSVYTCCNY